MIRSLLLVALLAAASACSLFDTGGGASADAGVGLDCDDNASCPADLVCAGGRCAAPGSVGLGAGCWANRDCEDGLFCTPQGLCGPAGTGEVGDVCGTGAECKPELYCDLFGFTGTCQAAGAGDLDAPCGVTSDCLPGLVCGDDDTCAHPSVAYPPFTGVTCEPDQDDFRIFFEVPRPGAPPADFYRLPFPSDARVSAAGALDIADFPRPGKGLIGVDLVDLYADALTEDFTGFSSLAPIAFRFSRALDFSTADSGDVVHLIDVTEGDPGFGQEQERSWGYTSAASLYHCQNFLTLRPSGAAPLRPGHTYAAFLTSAIRGEGDLEPSQDADLAAALGAARPTGDDALGRAWDAHAPMRAYLTAEVIAPATIAGAAVFTVQDAPARALAVAAAVASEPAPALADLTLCDGVATSPCEDALGRGACGAPSADYFEIHGRVTLPIYQAGTAPYERPTDGGAIAIVGDAAVKVRDEAVCFALTVPKATMPVGGWPTVVAAHGTGGSFTNAIAGGVAGALAGAAVPMATFSYDGVVHGERKADSAFSPDQLMFNVLNPRSARDNNLQGAADVLALLRLGELAPVDLVGVGAIDFDGARTYYFGHSQGSNVGVPAIAVSSAPAAIFSGAGAYLTRALLSKTNPVDAKAGLELVIGEELTTSHPIMVLWQTFFDSVDTANFGPLLIARPPATLPSKHIYMSYGFGDTYSPEPTLEAMASSAGLPIAEPVIEDLDLGTVARPISGNESGGDGQARTAACFQYQPDGYDGHFVATRNPAAVADWLGFLVTLAQDGIPTVE